MKSTVLEVKRVHIASIVNNVLLQVQDSDEHSRMYSSQCDYGIYPNLIETFTRRALGELPGPRTERPEVLVFPTLVVLQSALRLCGVYGKAE